MHVGSIGERKYWFLKCEKTHVYANQFRGRMIYSYMNFLVDRFGNNFVYKGSAQLVNGHYYGMTATIKSHQEYKGGELQTWVSRPKINKHLDTDGKEISS